MPSLPFEGRIERELPESTGELLVEIDSLLRSWNKTKLEVQRDDGRKQRALEAELERMVAWRFEDLAAELEFGPPRNRQIAALALGFAKDPAALGALLARLDDDREPVVQNALLGLGVLADPATPVESILRPLERSSDSITRNNAVFALLRLIEIDEEDSFGTEDTIEALRSALRDPEPGVRAQAAAAMQAVGTEAELEDLNDRLHDAQTLVASAALRAIGEIGRREDTARGRAARMIFESWTKSSGSLRSAAHFEMLLLSDGRDYGEEADWRDWAYRLP